jgi:nucleoid-associated protein YgaU
LLALYQARSQAKLTFEARLSIIKIEFSPGYPERSEAMSKTYTVKAGDNLQKIAKQLLGDASKWKEIYEANKDLIKDPNVINVGMELEIPGEEPKASPRHEMR